MLLCLFAGILVRWDQLSETSNRGTDANPDVCQRCLEVSSLAARHHQLRQASWRSHSSRQRASSSSSNTDKRSSTVGTVHSAMTSSAVNKHFLLGQYYTTLWSTYTHWHADMTMLISRQWQYDINMNDFDHIVFALRKWNEEIVYCVYWCRLHCNFLLKTIKLLSKNKSNIMIAVVKTYLHPSNI